MASAVSNDPLRDGSFVSASAQHLESRNRCGCHPDDAGPSPAANCSSAPCSSGTWAEAISLSNELRILSPLLASRYTSKTGSNLNPTGKVARIKHYFGVRLRCHHKGLCKHGQQSLEIALAPFAASGTTCDPGDSHFRRADARLNRS
jgi:hypothetical protein